MADPLPSGFKHGAVALLDSLGFKGIWRKYPPQLVLAQMSAAQRVFNEYLPTLEKIHAEFAHGGIPRMHHRLVHVSDSVFIATWYDDAPSDHADGFAVLATAGLSRGLIGSWAGPNAPHVVFRGVLTVGEFLTAGNFVIGPAIDEIASQERTAAGPFLWLTRSAERVWATGQSAAAGSKAGVRYSMPTREGRLDTIIINPLIAKESEEVKLEQLRNMLAACSGDAAKLANMRAFFAWAEPELMRRVDEDTAPSKLVDPAGSVDR